MRQSESGSLDERAAIQRLEFNIETSIDKYRETNPALKNLYRFGL